VNQLRRITTIKNLVAKYPEALTERYMRYLVHGSKPRKATVNGEPTVIEPNSFGPAFLRVGNRIFVDEDVFFQIIDQMNKDRRSGGSA